MVICRKMLQRLEQSIMIKIQECPFLFRARTGFAYTYIRAPGLTQENSCVRLFKVTTGTDCTTLSWHATKYAMKHNY